MRRLVSLFFIVVENGHCRRIQCDNANDATSAAYTVGCACVCVRAELHAQGTQTHHAFRIIVLSRHTTAVQYDET